MIQAVQNGPPIYSFYCVILYEHPFNERVRTYLRLEHLFQRFEELTTRNHPVDNHFALTTLFELVEAGGRTDLKSDILKDLDRHKQMFNGLRGNPSVSEAALDQLLYQLERCFEAMNNAIGKIGQSVTDNEWLAALRNRAAIPGGTCCFDLPAYHAWQQQSGDVRRLDILRVSSFLCIRRKHCNGEAFEHRPAGCVAQIIQLPHCGGELVGRRVSQIVHAV